MIKVPYVGGPRDGQTRDVDPNKTFLIVGCVSDAKAKGMHGVYRLKDGKLVWRDVPRKEK